MAWTTEGVLNERPWLADVRWAWIGGYGSITRGVSCRRDALTGRSSCGCEHRVCELGFHDIPLYDPA
jgi:hypothetical protein